MSVIGVSEADGEVTIEVETTEPQAWCERCGCRAESQDRMWVEVRDRECFGRPRRLRVWKRRWRCREALCVARTWTEPLEFLDSQVVLTRRTGAEASRRVGELALVGSASWVWMRRRSCARIGTITRSTRPVSSTWKAAD